MKNYLEKHKIAALVILVVVILILSILFIPQLNPIKDYIQNSIISTPENNPLYDDYVPQSDEEEPDQTSMGGSGSSEEPSPENPTSNESYLNSETYKTCVHTLFIQKCKEYLSLSTELSYEKGPGYVKCYNTQNTDEELIINVPIRIVYKRCGYLEPLKPRDICLKNMFIEMCLEDDLTYTEYGLALGTLICTDDGFYVEYDKDLHEKYKELKITEETKNTRCGSDDEAA